MITKEIGEKIRVKRLIERKSRKEMATFVGVTFSQILRYEQGIQEIPLKRLQKIAEFLKVEMKYFF